MNNSLVTHIGFELRPIIIFSQVANFGDQSIQLSYMQTKLHLQRKLPPRQNGVRVGPKSQTRVVTRLVARRRVCQFVFSAMQLKSLWSQSFLLHYIIYKLKIQWKIDLKFICTMPPFSWSIFIRAVIDHMICYNLNWPKIKL